MLVAAHYGNPTREQRVLAAGSGLVDLRNLDVVTVTGHGGLAWLEVMSSQVVKDLQPGESREILFLDPTGRVEFAAALAVTAPPAGPDAGDLTGAGQATKTPEPVIWLIVDAGQGPKLAEFLERMKFRTAVDIADVSAEYSVWGTAWVPTTAELLSPGNMRAGGALAAWGEESWRRLQIAGAVLTWVDPWPGVCPGGTTYGPPTDAHPARAAQFFFSVAPRSQRAQIVAEFCRLPDNITPGTARKKEIEYAPQLVGQLAWEALQVTAWRPRAGREGAQGVLPHEVDWLRTAVHLRKGCYCGQETVARVVNLGKPPRRLVFLHLDGLSLELPNAGDTVWAGGKQVGVITQAARHVDLGPVALAVIKRQVPGDELLQVHVTPDDTVFVAGEAGAVLREEPGLVAAAPADDLADGGYSAPSVDSVGAGAGAVAGIAVRAGAEAPGPVKATGFAARKRLLAGKGCQEPPAEVTEAEMQAWLRGTEAATKAKAKSGAIMPVPATQVLIVNPGGKAADSPAERPGHDLRARRRNSLP